MELILNSILVGQVLKRLQGLPDNCVNCIVTSPPYWGLRDYGVKGQIGLEKNPKEFIKKLVFIFRECKRVLKDDGTLWVNIGDSYAAAPKKRTSQQAARKSNLAGSNGTQISCKNQPNKITAGLKAKDLVGIPWMLAFALRTDGWYLRSDIIWAKPNPMPESVTDRPTKSHEYIFLLSKSSKYYYDADAIKVPVAEASVQRLSQDIENQNGSDRVPGKTNGKMKARASWNGSTFDTGKTGLMMETRGGRKSGNKERKNGSERGCPETSRSNVCSSVPWGGFTANKRSVWIVPTQPFKEAHFATFPPDLIVDCIKAGCPVDGVVLDIFFGAGTTGVVAIKLQRNFIGIELNPAYIKIADKRLRDEHGMFYKSNLI